MCLEIFFESAYSMKSQMIPSSGSPPNALLYSSAVYDEHTTSIVIIGGYSVIEEKETNSIYSFNIFTKKWAKILPESDFLPGTMQSHYSYLTKSRVLLNFFGISSNTVLSDVRAFDLNNSKWSVKGLSGDIINGRRFAIYTSFTHNDIEYIAVYGGFCEDRYDSSLYL